VGIVKYLYLDCLSAFRRTNLINKYKIAIIGAGWYGCHLALALKKEGHEVEIFEKASSIFSGISGQFGIRLHNGLHYPRSPETRKSCREGFANFKKIYPNLIIPHQYSIYGLGTTDVDGKESKVTCAEFERTCQEIEQCNKIDTDKWGYKNLISAYNVDEPSIAVGERLRSEFTNYLKEAQIEVHYGYNVSQLETSGTKVRLGNDLSSNQFDKVINATSYQAHIPKNLDFPFDMSVTYQPCLALNYIDTKPEDNPFSFIIMDGWFPCMMPFIDTDNKETPRKYILTHGKYTIMGAYNTEKEARNVLSNIDTSFVLAAIKPIVESEMQRFWPEFHENRFKYIGWKGTVLAKLKTKREFRSAVTYEKDNVIHIIPGKVSNIFDAEKEVHALISKEKILTVNGYSYVQGGVLDRSAMEITEKPSFFEANTANLKTFQQLKTAQKAPSLTFFDSKPHKNNKDIPVPKMTSLAFDLNESYGFYFLFGALSCSALLSYTILMLPIAMSIIITVSTIIGMGYLGYTFFSNDNHPTLNMNALERPILMSYATIIP
jgi:hypothetical protein